MKVFIANNLLAKCGFMLIVFLAAFALPARAGLDFYEIYLGKKLLMKRYVNQPLSLQQMPLGEAKAGEQLVIHYYQCNAPDKVGANRSIAIKDKAGNTLQRWTFANASGTNAAMAIPVEELLHWQKKSHGQPLSLYYNANGRSAGERLAYLATGKGEVSFLPSRKEKSRNDIACLLYPQFTFINRLYRGHTPLR